MLKYDLCLPFFMDAEEAIKTRRSIRDYKEGEISDGQLQKLLELVRLSPSSYNLQPWEFIVVKDAAAKKKLRACAHDQAHVEEAAATIIILGNMDPLAYMEEVGIDPAKAGRILKLREKSIEENKLWTVKSTSLAAMTLMLAAHSMGIASCPLEGFDEECVKEKFNIPDNFTVVMLITLGFAKDIPAPRQKRDVKDMLHVDSYT